MLSLYKNLFIFFVLLHLLSTQVNAETTSHIVYTSAWSAGGLAEGLNDELTLIQEQAERQGKYFNLVNISIVPGFAYAYILYNLSDSDGVTNPLITRVAYADAWSADGLAENLQDEINSLQNYAVKKEKFLRFLDFVVVDLWGAAYIIYETSR